ncbi:phosphoglycolate/pyridoxal phosphate phosphatase family protein [Dictyocaulus viviparus]|uniref:Phosphoglycolate/pyridoxal phosphate phosphatase family protein n=1 Tax=Dictyocaulus viviparus TaxID=29172 RepID=A0A0D8YAB1_DICVI|nr:phosphoglycolate/pyridoxal phosphate phosphatase family protein [Dictyocaulus viviparus]
MLRSLIRCSHKLLQRLLTNSGFEDMDPRRMKANSQSSAITKNDSNSVCQRTISTPVCRLQSQHSSEDSTQLLYPESFQVLLTKIDTFIFDGDGVLWLGENVISGSPLLIDFLIKKNKRVIVLTNNATKSRAKAIVSPAVVVADMLRRAGIAGSSKVYLIGSKGVRDEMDEVGIDYFGYGPEPQDNSDDSAFIFDIQYEVDPDEVGAVVVGYEKHFNYHKLMKAANYLQRPHCLFLATNEDETCPGPHPHILTPDAGESTLL